MYYDLRPRPVSQWSCPDCGTVAWGCAEQRAYWNTIHNCKGDEVPGIQEQIAAAEARLAKEQERLAALKKKAEEPPKRTRDRSAKQIQEILLLEAEAKKLYGCGFAGLADIARKAKKDGVTTPELSPDHTSVLPPAPPAVEAPREHHGDGDVPMPVEPDPIWDPEDEPPVPNPPEAVAVQQSDDLPPGWD